GPTATGQASRRGWRVPAQTLTSGMVSPGWSTVPTLSESRPPRGAHAAGGVPESAVRSFRRVETTPDHTRAPRRPPVGGRFRSHLDSCLMAWKETPAPIRITFWVALVFGVAMITLTILVLVLVRETYSFDL